MPFIIRAFNRIGLIGWVNPVNEIGHRLIGGRPDAEVFDDPLSARAVAIRLPTANTPKTRIEYSVHSTDEPLAAA